VKFQLSRRRFLAGCAGLCSTASEAAAQNKFIADVERLLYNLDRQPPSAEDEQYFDPALLPPPEAEVDYPIEIIDVTAIEPRNRPQEVCFDGNEPLGSIVVDPDNRFLYQVLAYGKARRCGVGVGRAGFAWSGFATIGMTRRWPCWVPPRSMVDLDPNA
jgi:lipoprotein-anchoring transpeptidase ErfK/SrfK